jgi:Fic family protein
MEVSQIENLVKEYQKLSKGMVDYTKYAFYAITHHSTSIEGSTLSESQVINLLEYGKTAINKPFEHHQMVFDHYQALQFIMQEAQSKKLIDIKFIQQIGAKVMKSTGGFVNTLAGSYNIANGDFRLGTVRAGTRTFPDFKKVPNFVENLCKEINKGLISSITFQDKCELAFQLHFDFVSIHPFGDGNGRTSRLLMNYVQAYFDLPLSIVYHQNRIKYIDVLEITRTKDNLQDFYKFMFQQYAKFLKNEIKQLNKLV